MVSGFAFTGRAQERKAGEALPGGEPDARQAAMMQEVSREMEKMGDGEPDPRALGHLMRKLQSASGEKLPAGMEEMIARMEKGEDLEKLEEEFADLPDEEEGVADEGQQSGAGRGTKKQRSTPTRDPKLYEMSEYLIG